MALKSEIIKAINKSSKKYIAKKVWSIVESEYSSNECYISIEVQVTKRKKIKSKPRIN